GITEQARAGAEGDDSPVAPLAHVRARVAHAVEGALQVDGDDRVPLLLAHVEDHAVAQDAGAGDERVEAAPGLECRAHEARGTVPGGDRIRVGHGLAAGAAYLLHHRILAFTWAGWLFDFYDLILYTFLLEPISRELGLARAAHAVLIGASLAATALGGALFGYLADRHGRRSVLQWSILTYSAGT